METVADKVLAIDDDESILSGYRTGFGRTHQVLTATTADEALRLASSETPALLVVDLRIGDDWGIALIRQLRALLPAAKIVLVSGFVSVTTAIAAIRAGADHVLPKPTSAVRILRELGTDAAETAETAETADELASLARVEWEHIMRALAEADGNVSRAARSLRIPRQSLQRRLRKRPPEA